MTLKVSLYKRDVEIEIEAIEAGPWHGFEISYKGYPMAFTHFCSSAKKEDWEKASINSIFIEKRQIEILINVLNSLLPESRRLKDVVRIEESKA